MKQEPASAFGEKVRIERRQAQDIVERMRAAAGVSIGPEKLAFIELRLGRRLREIGCPDFNTYLAILGGAGGREELANLVDCLTTNTTSFFRETAHYDWLATTGAPDLVRSGAGRERDFVVWSAACSLGSELWSAGMLLDELGDGPLGRLRFALHGTDISRRILERAALATFIDDELTGLDETRRRRHLLKSRGPVGGRMLYRISPELRRRARFSYANLMQLEGAPGVEVDVAFLRNVLIYFEPDQQTRAISGVAQRLRRGGYLLIGHSESLPAPIPGLRQVAPAVFLKE